MSANTIIVRVDRDQLIRDQKGKNASQFAQVGGRVLRDLRAAGVPIIGAIGLFGVEYGTLAMHIEDGLDGDELVYTFTGVPLPAALRKNEYTFSKPLKSVEPEDDEL